jgi:hypothetical protein
MFDSIEIGIIEVNGQSFEALGASVSATHIYAYPNPQGTGLTNWAGQPLPGKLRITGRARIGRNRLVCWQFTSPEGQRYHGRNSGVGMLLKLKASSK